MDAYAAYSWPRNGAMDHDPNRRTKLITLAYFFLFGKFRGRLKALGGAGICGNDWKSKISVTFKYVFSLFCILDFGALGVDSPTEGHNEMIEIRSEANGYLGKSFLCDRVGESWLGQTRVGSKGWMRAL